MATPDDPKRGTARTLIMIVIGTLLAFAAYSSYQPRTSLSPKAMLTTHADLDRIKAATEDSSSMAIRRRDTYQCSAKKPCGNGACCGKSGYCGYGPTYCGSGCLSNCSAVAECGKHAKIPGQKCPLNTCCSQYGFCGTTSNFCGTKCQSNCILNPTPPSGRSRKDILNNKVIGYYEAWSARKKCHDVKPMDLPLDALTHINFAFASIDPTSYEIVTMDSATPSSLFSDITNTKSIKQDLSIFISVGGWTFSNNGTATQHLFGEIASNAGKRQTFANNVVNFMRQYGFDGLDLDWEYPGAPDRGGKANDMENYVLLMQTLRSTFDSSGGKYGLTFTAPSSFWYLRWFDLPALMKYASWINLMTYDLHGAWDRTNPIGSIVQGHTNLTEIKLAAELFWRVGISPVDIVLGFGFYGRSFTLADPSCTSPGCAFRNASNPGPCTAEGGILGHYEIQDILARNPSITPVHDAKSAVMYFAWDRNQWVSFDNQKTFRQKVDWANSIGLGGAMIWASDLDDDKNTAHSALLGRKIIPTDILENENKALSNPHAVISSIASENGQSCFTYKGKCVHLDDTNAMQAACGSGNTVVGWDDAGCGTKRCHCGKPICCPNNAAPKNCVWRGDNNGQGASSDCSAQCAPGEINIKGISSSWGGGFTNDGNTDKCARGFKAFCCPIPGFSQLTKGCGYVGCRKSCPLGSKPIFESGACLAGTNPYCCPSPSNLNDCHWVTKTHSKGVDSDCANAVCNATEVEILRSDGGDAQGVRCAYGRQQAACCSVRVAPVTPATCSSNLCRTPGFCDDNGTTGTANNKRDLIDTIELTSIDDVRALNRRGQEQYSIRLPNGIIFIIITIAVSPIGRLFADRNANQVLRIQFLLRPGTCIGPAIDLLPIGPGLFPAGLTGSQTEHPIEPQMSKLFIPAWTSGLIGGAPAPNNLQPIDPNIIDHYWNHPLHGLNNAPPIGGPNGDKPITANDRFMGGLGSVAFPEPLMAVDQQINAAKGRLFALIDLTDEAVLTALADSATETDLAQDADNLLSHIRIAFAVFEYMNTPEFIHRWNLARTQTRLQLNYIQAAFANELNIDLRNPAGWWDAVVDHHLRTMESRTINWMDEALDDAHAAYVQANGNLPGGQTLRTWPSVQATLDQWRTMVNNDGQGLRFDQQLYSAAMQLPQLPGTGGVGSGSDSGSGSGGGTPGSGNGSPGGGNPGGGSPGGGSLGDGST